MNFLLETNVVSEAMRKQPNARVLRWERWADLEASTVKACRRLPVMDSLLAAIATAHHLTLATRNILDFEAAGVALLDPWQVS